MKRLLVLAVSALAIVLLSATPAAAEEYIGLGTDGISYSAELTDPLFDPNIRWVPGDTRSAVFYVRNQGGTPARLTLDLLGGNAGNLFNTGALRVTATGTGGKSTTASDGRRHRLLIVPSLAVSGVVPVTVTVAFDRNAPSGSQLSSADLGFQVNLRQNAAVGGQDDGGPQENGGSQETGGSQGNLGSQASVGLQENLGFLPSTGAASLGWIIAFATICLGGGFGILTRRSTHEEGASHG